MNTGQTSPLISVVMPVFNEEKYLSEAIESIVTQTYRNFEFIVVDDGSTDGTSQLLDHWRRRDDRIIVIHQSNAGITRALNAGLEKARGEFIARMDGNDVAMPNRFAAQLKYLNNHAEVVAVGGAIDLIDEDGDWLGHRVHLDDHTKLMEALCGKAMIPGASIPHSGAMMRTEPLRAIGGYDPQFQAAQDRDLWLRISERGQLGNAPETILAVRLLVENGISSTKANIQRDCAIKAIHASYARRGETIPETLDLYPVADVSASKRRIALALAAFSQGGHQVAQKHAWRAILSQPDSYHAWKAFTRIVRKRLKRSILRFR